MYRTILHVDDEDTSAFLVRAALERATIANPIFRVCDGENALAFLFKTGLYCEAQTPCLLILDLHMPRIDGWSVLRNVKGHAELKPIPVVVLSWSDSEADRGRALEMGAKHFITKQKTIAAMQDALMRECGSLLFPSVALGDADMTLTMSTAAAALDRQVENGVETRAC